MYSCMLIVAVIINFILIGVVIFENMESKNKVIKPMESDSEGDDDDMPPPLEDMSDHLQAIKTIKDNDTNKVTAKKAKNDDEEEEEIRLAQKKT